MSSQNTEHRGQSTEDRNPKSEIRNPTTPTPKSEIRNPKSEPRITGFTLTEIMVTLTIIGLLAVLIHASFGICMQSWKKGENKLEAYQQLRAGLSLLSNRISSTFVSPFKPEMAFEGGLSHLNFTALTSIDGELKNISFKVVDQMLVMEEKSLLETAETEETVLIKGVSYLEFEYYEQANQRWVTNWDSKTQSGLLGAVILPGAVRVSLTIYTHQTQAQTSASGQSTRLVLPPVVIPIKTNRQTGKIAKGA